MNVGVLALQGAYHAHVRTLRSLGVSTTEIRKPADLDGLSGVILPGGESTTMSMLLDSSGLRQPLTELGNSGVAMLGTCAGLIMLASKIADGRDDQLPLGLLDVDVQRNGYGRQLDSFECELDVDINGMQRMHGVFIRAPKITRIGNGVRVLAALDGIPVLVEHGACLGASFHPELGNSMLIHRHFLQLAEASAPATTPPLTHLGSR